MGGAAGPANRADQAAALVRSRAGPLREDDPESYQDDHGEACQQHDRGPCEPATECDLIAGTFRAIFSAHEAQGHRQRLP